MLYFGRLRLSTIFYSTLGAQEMNSNRIRKYFRAKYSQRKAGR